MVNNTSIPMVNNTSMYRGAENIKGVKLLLPLTNNISFDISQ